MNLNLVVLTEVSNKVNNRITSVFAFIAILAAGLPEAQGANITASMTDEEYVQSVPKYILPIVYSQGRLEQETKFLHEAVVNSKQDTNKAIGELKQDMNQRFDELKKDVGRRFDEAKKDVDERFDKVDQRFDKVDQRFDRMDQRFDRMEAQLAAYRQDQIEFGQNITSILESAVKRMADLHESFANRTEARLDKLEAHWSYNFSDFVLYNPLTYAALGAVIGAIKMEAWTIFYQQS